MVDTAGWSDVSALTSSAGKTKTKQFNTSLGKDDFLKILITQLQNQDPAEPLQDKEFIAQMAQFTSVEQLGNISSEMKLMRQSIGLVSGLIGKTVSWTETDSTGTLVTKTGVVDSISMKSDGQYANVGGSALSLDSIIKIENTGHAS